MSRLQNYRLLVALPVAALVIGTVGFMLLEGLSPIDALYFTLVTISTVGYGDIHPTTTASKIFGIFLIIFGIGTFLAIITTVTQKLVQMGAEKQRRLRLQMLIGVFFTEVGNQLLAMLVTFDPHVDSIRRDCLVDDSWTGDRFGQLGKKLSKHAFDISPELIDLEKTRLFLQQKGDMLIRQIENHDLIEHESFTELLWSIIHLRDELLSRKSLRGLPETDIAHLANDVKRVYTQLVRRWLEYLQYLKARYPYLFSLALRTNPFCEDASAIVE